MLSCCLAFQLTRPAFGGKGCQMHRLSRRPVLGGAAVTAAAVTLGAPSVHAPKRGRVVQLLVMHTGKLAPVDQKTFTSELAECFAPCSTRWGSRQATCPS